MGLVMSPMSTAAMNAVDRTKAGVASGVLSMSRMVGGTFGVAVMGALITTIGRSKIDAGLPHVPAATRAAIANSLGGGGAVTGHHVSAQIVTTVREAYVSALSTGLLIGAATTLVGAVVAWVLIQKTPTVAEPAPAAIAGAEPETAPEPPVEAGIV
jgi:hypothetical protein